jgi:hypothetical protein
MSEIDLSVILVTASSYERIRKTIRHLAAQDIANHMQLIIVHQTERPIEVLPEDTEQLGEVTLFATGTFQSTGDPRADAVSVAKGTRTVFAEDHSFPEPGWARALLAAHAMGYPVVGPSMRPSNPDTTLGWADMCLNFGPSAAPTESEETSLLCWHNLSYSTDLLRAQENLGELLEAEGVFFRRLENQGQKLYRAAEAQVLHTNLSAMRGFFLGQFWGARLFWSTLVSVEDWSWPKRLFFTALTPLVSLRRFLRAVKDFHRTAPGPSISALPYLLLASILIPAGAIAGLLAGSGNCMQYRLSLEFERERYVARGEEQIIFV